MSSMPDKTENHLGGPDHGLDIPQAALSLLDMGLQEIAVTAETEPPVITVLLHLLDKGITSPLDKAIS